MKSPSKVRPNRKKEFDRLDEFDLGVVGRMMHLFYARSENLANIYFFCTEILSKILKHCVEHGKLTG